MRRRLAVFLSLALMGFGTLAAAGADLPLWYRPSGFLGPSYQSSAAKDMEERLLKVDRPEDPDAWTAPQRIAGLRQRFVDFEALRKSLLSPDATRFFDVAKRLHAKGNLSWDTMRALYRRERLDMSEAEDLAFRNLLSTWRQEIMAFRAWGPLLAQPEILQKLFTRSDLASRESFLQATAKRLDDIGKVMSQLSQEDVLTLAMLPTELQAGGSLSRQVWPSGFDLDFSADVYGSDPAPAPTSNSGALEKELFTLEKVLLSEIPSCDLVTSFPAYVRSNHQARGGEIAALRSRLWEGRASADAALQNAKEVLDLLSKVQNPLEIWKSRPELLSLLLAEVSRDEFQSFSLSWAPLLKSARPRLPPGMLTQAKAVEKLLRLGELTRGRISLYGFERISADLQDLLQNALERFNMPESVVRFEKQLSIFRQSLTFEKRRLENARPRQEDAVPYVKIQLQRIWRSYRMPTMPWPDPTAEPSPLMDWDSLQTEADIVKQIRILRSIAEKDAVKARDAAERCEKTIPAGGLSQ